jgi:hypothetical protein
MVLRRATSRSGAAAAEAAFDFRDVFDLSGGIDAVYEFGGIGRIFRKRVVCHEFSVTFRKGFYG